MAKKKRKAVRKGKQSRRASGKGKHSKVRKMIKLAKGRKSKKK